MRNLLKIFALLIVTANISSCASNPSLPKKPQIWSCVMIYVTQTAFCINNQTREEKEIPFSAMNKYVAFSNPDWGLILKYVKELESRIPKSRKQLRGLRLELVKILKMGDQLEKRFNEKAYVY